MLKNLSEHAKTNKMVLSDLPLKLNLKSLLEALSGPCAS